MVESNPGHWEVVGGKPSKGKSTKSSKNSKNASNKTAAANFSSKTIKVDELGNSNLLVYLFIATANECVYPFSLTFRKSVCHS